MKIIIKYPPDFDGELWIEAKDNKNGSYSYSFTNAKVGSEWDTLVEAAKGILNQAKRIKAERGRILK